MRTAYQKPFIQSVRADYATVFYRMKHKIWPANYNAAVCPRCGNFVNHEIARLYFYFGNLSLCELRYNFQKCAIFKSQLIFIGLRWAIQPLLWGVSWRLEFF